MIKDREYWDELAGGLGYEVSNSIPTDRVWYRDWKVCSKWHEIGIPFEIMRWYRRGDFIFGVQYKEYGPFRGSKSSHVGCFIFINRIDDERPVMGGKIYSDDHVLEIIHRYEIEGWERVWESELLIRGMVEHRDMALCVGIPWMEGFVGSVYSS